MVEQDRPFPAFEATQVQGLFRQLHSPRPQLGNLFDGDKDLPSADLVTETNKWRVPSPTESHDQVIDPAQHFPSPINYRTLDDACQGQGQ